MALEVQSPPEQQGFTSLVRGVINDIGDLIKQELRFARAEVRSDLHKSREAILALATHGAQLLLAALPTHGAQSVVAVSHGGVTIPDTSVQPVWAGFVRAMPWLVSHSYPALPSLGPGSWPGGFLLSALPTHPAHGLPTALPLPFPFSDGAPLRVESYGPWVFAPWPLKSAFEGGCGVV